MPKIKVDDITMNYEQQGTGEPLVLIPYLAADNACYAKTAVTGQAVGIAAALSQAAGAC